MKVHITEPLFGLDAFSPPEERSAPMETAAAGFEDALSVPLSREKAIHHTEQTDTTALQADVQKIPQSGECGSMRRTIAGMLLFLLFSAAALSVFSLVMKTQRRSVSYELARQTRLFSRISKHRAMLNLEYAYLRSTSPVLEEFTRQGWQEVTPRDVIHIRMKPSKSIDREWKKPW